MKRVVYFMILMLTALTGVPAFAEETRRLSQKYIKQVNEDVTHFCRMHDYRNQGQDWGNSRDSIERAIQFLTSREPTAIAKASEKNR